MRFTYQLEAIQAKSETERSLSNRFSKYGNRFGLMTLVGAAIILCSGAIHLFRRMRVT